jgi:glycosyltransferase involved in cell wall biosynthesis
MTDDQAWPRISIVTPSYNQGHLIEETIRSVLLQGHPDLEYIIIDGGSTDNSVEIIRKYESWLAYWISEPDRGQGHAINKGWKHASGVMVSWLNSDDILYKNALQRIGKAVREHPDAGMIYGAGAKIDLNGNVVKDIPFRPFDKRLIRTRFFVLQQSSFYDLRALETLNGVNEHIYYWMDWDLVLRISEIYAVYSISHKIGMFRIQPGAKTQKSGWDRKIELAKIAKRHNGVFDKNYLSFVVHNPIEKISKPCLYKPLKFFAALFCDLLFRRSTYMMR